MNENPFVVPPHIQSPGGGEPVPGNKEESTLGVVFHLLAFAGLAVPFGNILGPLVLWLLKRGDSPYLDAVGKEVVNFNISWMIYTAIAAFSLFVLVGFLLLPLVALAWLVLVIIAAIKASEGKFYRYPLTIRLIK